MLRNPARDAPERHRSLRATFEWSHGLLAPAHQVLFARLGAFAGPVPLDAVEAVGAADALVSARGADGLLAGATRRVGRPHGWRFTMPQALRDFARDKLAASAEQDAVRRRHAEHVLAVAGAARVWFAVPGPAAPAARDRRGAAPSAAWAAAHDPELYRELVAELGLGLCGAATSAS